MMKVLDHGYVDFVEAWGSDESIICAARMSTGGAFKGWGPKPKENCQECDVHGRDCPPLPGDEKLLRYLYENKHATPFEMAGLVIEVQAPIFVFREWHRHRAASINEASARYSPLPDLNYVPTVERLMINAGGTNKQAGTVAGSEALTIENAETFQNDLRRSYVLAEELYQGALRCGVPKELARVHLPVGRYSRMRWSANLRMVLHFLELRLDLAAQYEIRVYAEAVAKLVAEKFPRTYELFAEGQR